MIGNIGINKEIWFFFNQYVIPLWTKKKILEIKCLEAWKIKIKKKKNKVTVHKYLYKYREFQKCFSFWDVQAVSEK